jgi:hypothetical protein
MKIGIVLPFHLRGANNNLPYAFTFRYYSKLKHLVHVCGSEGNLSLNFAVKHGPQCRYVEVKQGPICNESAGNDVLRKKFNDSLKTLPKDLDWYCLAGANDIVSPDFFRQLEVLDPTGIKMAGVGMDQKLFCVEMYRNNIVTSWKLQYQIPLKLLPGINCFSYEAMQVVNFEPYARKGCETGAEQLIAEIGEICPLNGSVTMLKGKHDLNSMDSIKRKHKQVDLSQADVEYLRGLL